MELVQDFMPVLVVCKFEQDLIKTEGAQSKLKALSFPQYFFQCSRAGNSEVNGKVCPEFELV